MLLESVGINPEASRLAGVRHRTIVFAVYVFCALCAGIAGLMIASNISAADANNAGLWIEMDAILAVVIGGTSLLGGRFSLTGTILGALIIQTLTTTVYTAGITPETTLVFKALVVIAVCLLQAPKFRALLSRRRSEARRAHAHRRTPRISTGAQPLRSPTRRRTRHRLRPRWRRSEHTMSVQTATRPRVDTTELLRRVRGRYLSPIASLVLFVIMFAAVIARYDFASPTQVFLNLLVDNAYLIVLAVGMTFVILTGGIDLSVGSVVALSTVIVATTLKAGWPMPLAVGTVLVVGPLLGLLMGLVIEYFDVQPFIVTLAGMFLARGLCYVISVDTLPINDPHAARSSA